MQLLRSQLYEIELRKRQFERDKIEGSKKKIEWVLKLETMFCTPTKWLKI